MSATYVYYDENKLNFDCFFCLINDNYDGIQVTKLSIVHFDEMMMMSSLL